MIGNPLLLPDEGYNISRSVRLRSSATAYFNRTPGSAGNRRTWTWSGWVKRGTLGAEQSVFSADTSNRDNIVFTSDNKLWVYFFSTSSGQVLTTQVFRDPSAWYHVAVAVDTTQATSSNRVKIYINGVLVTALDTASYPTQNYDGKINSTVSHAIGKDTSGTSYFDGYLTEINFIDGQALTPSSFGETDILTGVWKPKKYTGTYGTNGFYLNFSDPSAATATTIGKDYSGNGNNWTPNNISVTSGSTYDSMLDVPTLWADGGNGRGNYCVVNPLDRGSSSTLNDGNLRLNNNYTGTPYHSARATFGVPSGKWYWEVVCTTVSGDSPSVGIANASASMTNFLGADANSWVYVLATGAKGNAGNTAQTYGASVASGDIVGVALDMDAGSIVFYKNNTSQGTAFTGITGTIFPASFAFNTSVLNHNFGQRPFAYTPPTGFKALNTQNLPEPTIKKGNQWFDVKLYTGNGTSQTISGLAFSPDLVWQKTRTGTGWHNLVDQVRGAGYRLFSNTTSAESYAATNLTAFTSDGFSIGNDVDWNTNASTNVAWTWKEGATPGFDIVTYTGTGANRTVSHALGVVPSLMLVKVRSTTNSWRVYHINTGGDRFLELNTTAASTVQTNIWNSTLPTSSVFTVGTDGGVNASGQTFVAYLFAEVAGFSKFGSYTGNGSADGPFVFTGFRPKWVMTKRTDSSTSGNWMITDSARNTYNLAGEILIPNLSDAEYSQDGIDMLSNGFKMRASTGNRNTNGGTFIYAAFAETAFKFSLSR